MMIKQLATTAILLTAASGAFAQASCDRDELEAATESYLAAQKAGELSPLPLADEVRYRENMEDVSRSDGLWNTALPVAHSYSIHDDTRCKTLTKLIVTEHDTQYVIDTRLYMDGGEVTRIDSLVTQQGDWLFNADATLKFAKRENWGDHDPTDGQEMINKGNAYLDLFADKHVEAAWGVPCARLEGGAYTNAEGEPDASCQIGVPDGVLYINNRDYVVDEERGVVNVYCRFGSTEDGMPDSHTFKFQDGKYRYIHTVTVNPDRENNPSPQAGDDGSMQLDDWEG